MSMENRGMISTGENSEFFALWQSKQQRHLVAHQEQLGEGNEFSLRNIVDHTVISSQVLFHDGSLLHSQVQYTTVDYSSQLL
jgi:hypothetical protein